jgi:TonB family protein
MGELALGVKENRTNSGTKFPLGSLATAAIPSWPHGVAGGGTCQGCPSARAKGIAGTVRLIGIVSKQGFLQNLRVLNTDIDPGLATAAMEAASHWQYRPSLLNGEPVEVLTNIDITFELVQ